MIGAIRATVLLVGIGTLAVWSASPSGPVGAETVPSGSATEAEAAMTEETYGAWRVICAPLPEGQGAEASRICEMRQDLRERPEGPLLGSVALQIAEGGEAAELSLLVPLGLHALEPVRLEAGSETIVEASLQTCLPRGCVASATIEPAQAARLAAARDLRLTMVTFSEGDGALPLSEDGFAQSLTRLLEAQGADWGFTEDMPATEAVARADSAAEPEADEVSSQAMPAQGSSLERPYTQIGLFRRAANANAAQGAAEQAGLPAVIREGTSRQGQPFWRVLIGPAANREEQGRHLAGARALGFEDVYHVRR